MWDGGFRVTIGGFDLFGEDAHGCQWLVNSADGLLDGVGTTHEHSSRVWGDGFFANRSSRNGRSMSLDGFVAASSQAAFDASRQSLLSAIGLGEVTMIVDAYGVRRLYKVRQDSGEIKMARAGVGTWRFSIPLVSLSPYAFDAGDPLSGSTGLPSSSGGMRLPAAFLGGLAWDDPPGADVDGWSGNILDDPDIKSVAAWAWSGAAMGRVAGADFNHLRLRPSKGWNRLYNSGRVVLGPGDQALVSARLAGEALDPSIDVFLGVFPDTGGGRQAKVGPVTAGSWSDYSVTVTVPDDAPRASWQLNFMTNNPDDKTGVLKVAKPSVRVRRSTVGDVPDGWVFSETVVSGEVNLTNPGGAPSPVTLRVDGPVTAPRIEHDPSGGVLELSSTIGAGHYVLFDSQSRQVLVDGRDPARGAVVRRGWSDALPGQNTWRFSARDLTQGGRLSVSFRPAYL